MSQKEIKRIEEIEENLKHLRHTYENLLPIHSVVDRKKRNLELEIKVLDDERIKLSQGQLIFDPNF